MTRIGFRILGALEVEADGRPMGLRGSRNRAILATLLLDAGRVVPVPRLIDAVWDDDPPHHAGKAVRNGVSALRSWLDQLGTRGLIETDPSGYRLRLTGADLDAERFRDQLAQARRMAATGQAPQAVTCLRGGLALWRGPAFAGFTSRVLTAGAVRMEEQRLAALEQCLDLELALGRHRELIGELRGLVGEWPLREGMVGRLMLALYRSGRRADALEAYERFRERLAADLGLDPTVELARTHGTILRADPVAEPAAWGRTAGRGQSSAHGPANGHPSAVAPAQLPSPVSDFTARGAELATLDALLGDPDGGSGLAVVTGPVGVGKSGLAVHWAHRRHDWFPDGQLYADLSSREGTAAPRPEEVLIRFLRSMDVQPERVPSGDHAPLFRSLLDVRKVLIVLDGARSADQVRPLLPGGSACRVLVTSRDELRGLTAVDGARRLTLPRLTAAESSALLTRLVGAERVSAEPSAAAALAERCAGLPLALRIAAARLDGDRYRNIGELVADLRDPPRLDVLSLEADDAASVRAAFATAYAPLAPQVRAMFRILGLFPQGYRFTAQAAGALLDLPVREAESLLEHLVTVHLVVRHPPDRFGLHPLLRAYAAERTDAEDSLAEREAAMARLTTSRSGR